MNTISQCLRFTDETQFYGNMQKPMGSKQQKGVCALERGKEFSFSLVLFLKKIHLIMLLNIVLDLLF